jgi:hypothetical protein
LYFCGATRVLNSLASGKPVNIAQSLARDRDSRAIDITFVAYI